MLPSGCTMPLAPGRAEVGRRTATTVATANGRPAASSSAARVKVEAVIAGSGSGDALLVQERPHLLRRDRDVDVPDAEVPQGIDDSVRDRRRGADRGRLPDALGPEWMVGRGSDGLPGLPRRSFDRGRQQVIEEGAGQVVPLLGVWELLVHTGSHKHCETAVALAFDGHGIDEVAAVIDRDEPSDADLTGPLVDIDDADVAAEGICEVGRVVVVDRFEAHLHP